MVCSSCGTGNEVGRKFCKACGERLAIACPACATPNTPDSRFCGECGGPLGGASAATVPAVERAESAPTAERRLVSVLFADLVGFTTLSEGRDAEDTRELLTRWFELARLVIERYGGLVEKFIGDAVMAVWGSPVAREDDAERAVRAALDLVEAVPALGPGVAARAGVLTGEAAVTLGATSQGMVAGDLVNTAARLQSVARAGTVLVGEATQRAAGRAIAFEAAGDQLLKGRTAPVAAWQAIRVVAERGGRSRADVPEAPFVGRADELRLLKDLFHATVREGRARLVSVFGPAGIGKTRLAWEFLKHVDGLVEPVWWHDGRCPAYGDGASFWALGEMVRARCGLRESDDAATTRARVSATVEQHVSDAAERRWLEPALLTLLGVADDAPSDQQVAAWRTFFERLADTAPVVLAFEDFHLADDGLIDFVDGLLDWSRGSRIHVLTLARPDLLERRPGWGSGKRNFVALHLEPLAEPEMRELLAGLVPGLPEAAVAAIAGRADGIPLYAVETVRMLLAQGRLRMEDGVHRPVGDLDRISVPETLTALVASRLDALSAADRSLVSDAAVLGQSFSAPALSAVSGIPTADLEPRLAALVRRELLRRQLDPRSPERGQHAFVQSLIREVAYNTLARRDRAVRHLAAARHFEGQGSDELAGVVAGHYLAAQAALPPGPDADAAAERARITLRSAADRASALGSPRQALGFLEQAIAVTADPGQRAELLEAAGTAADARGDTDRARALLTEAIALHEATGDPRARLRATTELARLLLGSGAWEAGTAVVEAALPMLGPLEREPEGVALRAQLARGRYLLSRPAEAIASADDTLVDAEAAGLEAIVADLLVTKGSALLGVQRPREGLGLIEAGRILAEQVGATLTVLRARLNGMDEVAEDGPGEALERAAGALELLWRVGQTGTMVPFVEAFATQTMWTGDWDRGLAQVARAAEHVDEEAQAHLLAVQWFYAILRGASAGPLLEQLGPLLQASTDRFIDGHLAGLQAAQALVEGRVEPGLEGSRWSREHLPDQPDPIGDRFLLHAAVLARDAEVVGEVAERVRDRPMRGRARRARAGLVLAAEAALAGREQEARAAYGSALRQLDDLGSRFDTALAAIEMASLFDPADPGIAAALRDARALLRTVGAAPLLARLEAVVSP